MRPVRAAAVLAGLFALCGCDLTGGVAYQPPLLPIVFTLSSTGEFGVQLGRGITTPFGRVGVETALKEPDKDETIVTIARQGEAMEDRFKIKRRGSMTVCVDGPSITSISSGVIRVVVPREATTVRVVDPSRAHSECRGAVVARRGARPGPPPAGWAPRRPQAGQRLDPSALPTVEVGLMGRRHRLALVDRPEQMALGMREWSPADLGDRSGMLYRYPSPQVGAHSLSGYRFVTDVFFFDASGRFLMGFTGWPCAQPPAVCPRYSPWVGFSYVIEAPSGYLPYPAPGASLTVH